MACYFFAVWTDDLCCKLLCVRYLWHAFPCVMLHLTQLDPLSPDLYLCILTTNKAKTAFFVVPYQIAGLVEPAVTPGMACCSLQKPYRIFDECCCRFARVVEVAISDERAF